MGTQNFPAIPSPGSAFVAEGGAGELYGSGTNAPSEDAWVDQVFVYCGGNSQPGFGNSANFTFGLFDSSGSILAQSGSLNYGPGFGWNHGTFSSLYRVGNGTQVKVGFWADAAPQIHQNFGNGSYFWKGGGSGLTSATGGNQNNQGNGGDLYWYCTYFPTVQVNSVSQTPVGLGQTFTLSGRSYTSGINSIQINGVAGNVAVTSYSVDSDSQITCTVPSGGSTGTVTVNSNAGSATSSQTVLISGGFYKIGGVVNTTKGMFYKDNSGVLHAVKGLFYKDSSGILHPVK